MNDFLFIVYLENIKRIWGNLLKRKLKDHGFKLWLIQRSIYVFEVLRDRKMYLLYALINKKKYVMKEMLHNDELNLI